MQKNQNLHFGNMCGDITESLGKNRRKMVAIINLERQSKAQHFSNAESCVLLEREGFVIGLWSNLEDEIRRNGCVLEVRMTTETHNVRVHWAGEKKYNNKEKQH